MQTIWSKAFGFSRMPAHTSAGSVAPWTAGSARSLLQLQSHQTSPLVLFAVTVRFKNRLAENANQGIIRGWDGRHLPRSKRKWGTLIEPRPRWRMLPRRPSERAKLTPRILTLNTIANNPGAKKGKRRVGRGNGSGRGNTCGRGDKGQRSRRGHRLRVWFEGGQTPLYKRLPKIAKPPGKPDLNQYLSLGRLSDWITDGRIDPRVVITMKHIHDSNVIGRIKHGVRLTEAGARRLKQPIHIRVSDVTPEARQIIEDMGGKVEVVYYTPLTLRALLKPHKFDILPRPVDMPPRVYSRIMGEPIVTTRLKDWHAKQAAKK